MSLRFDGDKRIQKGQGIRGILQFAKGLFFSLISMVRRALKFDTDKALENALKNKRSQVLLI